ncbi:helix-turn-helix domain-containing protein [Fusicatenibacter sp.]
MEEKIEIGRLSLNQVKYLTLLDQCKQKRGSVQKIADWCGVRHPTVSRFFKACTEQGYLTKELVLTEKGRRILSWNQYLAKEVRQYLTDLGVEEGMDDFAKGILENVDYNIIEKTISKRAVITDNTRMKKAASVIDNIDGIIEPGEHPVRISLFRVNPMERAQKSMADRGFEKTATIIHNEKESCLELTVKEMHAISRVDGHDMTGHLSSLKYLCYGSLKQAEINQGKVRIPLDVCTYEVYDHGIIWGNVSITVACSVGSAHMPESTARLMFIL